MGLEQRVEHLTGEMAGIKEELVQTQAQLRSVLKSLGAFVEARAPVAVGSGVAVGHGAQQAGSPSGNGGSHAGPDDGSTMLSTQISAERPRGQPAGNGKGGLVLTQSELQTMVSEARTGARRPAGAGGRNGDGPVGLSLEGLAQSLRKARQGSGQGTEEPVDGSMTMSLSDLARMMRDARNGRTQRVETSSPKAASPSEISNPWSRGTGPTKGSRQRATTASTQSSPSVTTSIGQSQKPAVETKRIHGSGNGGEKLDVNLLANLIRWAGAAKLRLGGSNLQALLEVYKLTGHLSGAIQKTIWQVAGMDVVFSPHAGVRPACTHDDLMDVLLQLHGIVYGAGSAPAVPAVDFDLSETPLPDFEEMVEEIPSGGAAEGRPEYATPDNSQTGRATEHGETQHVVRHSYEVAPSAAGDAGTAEAVNTPGTMVSIRDILEDLGLAGAETRSRGGAVHDDASVTPVVNGEGARHTSGFNGVQQGHDFNPAPRREAVPSGRVHPSDVSDEEWRRVAPVIPPPKSGGRPCKYDRREILNGILYQTRMGCSWRSLPSDLPPWKIVHHYYRTWRDVGAWGLINEALQTMETEGLTGTADSLKKSEAVSTSRL